MRENNNKGDERMGKSVNNLLNECGASELFNIGGKNGLEWYIGKSVMYKPHLQRDKAFVKANGTIIINRVFVIKETQRNYKGEPRLRGYWDGDTFGRPINHNDVDVVSMN